MTLTPDDRARLLSLYRGQSGPVCGWEEHIVAQENANGDREVILTTTRPATVADLLDSDRPILSVREVGDAIRVTLPGDEYRTGGVLGALRRRSTMSDEARQAAGDRLRAARAKGGA